MPALQGVAPEEGVSGEGACHAGLGCPGGGLGGGRERPAPSRLSGRVGVVARFLELRDLIDSPSGRRRAGSARSASTGGLVPAPPSGSRTPPGPWRAHPPPARAAASQNLEDDARVVFGLTFTLQSFCANMDPTPSRKGLGQKLTLGEGSGFRSFATSAYRLHFFVSPSGVRFVLLTTPDVEDASDVLRGIYRHAFCPFVSRNPLAAPGEPIDSEGFSRALDEAVGGI